MRGMSPRISTVALWRSLRRVLAMLGLLLVVALGTGGAIVMQAGRTENVPATAAVVMLGANRGTPARIDRARQLYSEGKIKRILLVGSDLGDSRATLQRRGVNESAIIDLRAPDQMAQLAAVKSALEHERLATALLIAEPVETLRLLKIARDAPLRLRLVNTPLGADNDLSPQDVAREIGLYFRYVLLHT